MTPLDSSGSGAPGLPVGSGRSARPEGRHTEVAALDPARDTDRSLHEIVATFRAALSSAAS